MNRVEGPVLELQKVRRGEAGSYLCIASNGHPPTVSRRLQLDVKCKTHADMKCIRKIFQPSLSAVRPLVHVPVQKVSASPGRRVQLECNVEAFPRAEVTWEWRGERGAPPTRIESDSKCEDD